MVCSTVMTTILLCSAVMTSIVLRSAMLTTVLVRSAVMTTIVVCSAVMTTIVVRSQIMATTVVIHSSALVRSDATAEVATKTASTATTGEATHSLMCTRGRINLTSHLFFRIAAFS